MSSGDADAAPAPGTEQADVSTGAALTFPKGSYVLLWGMHHWIIIAIPNIETPTFYYIDT